MLLAALHQTTLTTASPTIAGELGQLGGLDRLPRTVTPMSCWMFD